VYVHIKYVICIMCVYIHIYTRVREKIGVARIHPDHSSVAFHGSVSETPRMINDVAGGEIQIFSSFPSRRGDDEQQKRLR